jgi:hypothetical protein
MESQAKVSAANAGRTEKWGHLYGYRPPAIQKSIAACQYLYNLDY